MKYFMQSTFLLAMAIQLIVLWINLIYGDKYEATEYQHWMLIILFIGCGFAVGTIMNILEWYKKKK